jgi:SPX domain protein involved in polyphosphate accumulation
VSLSAAIGEGDAPRRDSSARLIADREERKYLLAAAEAASFVASVAPLMPLHRYGGSSPDAAASYATTVYFDSPGRDLYRVAVSQPKHAKVRVREYYEVPLGLEQRAAEPPALDARVIWLELKVRDGQRSRKRRVCLAKHELERWFGALDADADDQVGEPSQAPERAELAAELRRLQRELAAPLAPSCAVNYRRLSWQDESQALRITLDHDVCAFSAAAELLHERALLRRQFLGAPAFVEPHAVLEIKSAGAFPSWVAELLRAHGATAVNYSKFVMASRAVHGPF